ncbi:MAG: hypothetical protein ABFC57_10810 [Veillonellales bacterium]
MFNPTFKKCKKNVWKKVATNVTTGQIWKADHEPTIVAKLENKENAETFFNFGMVFFEPQF